MMEPMIPPDDDDVSYEMVFGKTFEEWRRDRKVELSQMIGATVVGVSESIKNDSVVFGLLVKTPSGEGFSIWAFEDEKCDWSGHLEITEAIIDTSLLE